MVAKKKLGRSGNIANFPGGELFGTKDEPVQDELFQPLTKVEGPQRYRMPKYPPSHLGKSWMKPISWGQVVGREVLVAFPEEWFPGRVMTKLRDLVLSPGTVTVVLDRGGIIEADTLMSLRIEATAKDTLKRSLHGG